MLEKSPYLRNEIKTSRGDSLHFPYWAHIIKLISKSRRLYKIIPEFNIDFVPPYIFHRVGNNYPTGTNVFHNRGREFFCGPERLWNFGGISHGMGLGMIGSAESSLDSMKWMWPITPKFEINSKHDALQKATPFKYGYLGIYMFKFGGVKSIGSSILL